MVMRDIDNFCGTKVLSAGRETPETSSVARVRCSNEEMIDFFVQNRTTQRDVSTFLECCKNCSI